MNRKPLVLGHRGYRKMFPENTLLSFSKAYEYGADGIECDIQKSSDGVYFVFHDEELDRITGHHGMIGAEKSSDIRKLNAGSGERIPEIDEFLDSLPPGKLINIELKEETLTVSDSIVIIGLLKSRGLADEILISSFKHDLLPPFKKAGFKTGLLFETVTLTNKPLAGILSMIRHRPWSVNLPVYIFTGKLSVAVRLFVIAAKLLKTKFIFWTVNTGEQYNAVKGFAHTVITDDVEQMIGLRDA